MFVTVIWSAIGLTGQVMVMAGLTTLAGVATAVSARRLLAATAEAFGVITLGLTVVDLIAVRHYNLAGAGAATQSWYVGISLVVIGVVSLVLHITASGLRVSLPSAAIALVWSPWAPLLQYGNSDATRIALLGLAVAVVDLGLCIAFAKAGGDPRFPARRVACLIAQGVTALACTVQVVGSLTTFLSLDGLAPRYGVWAALWVVPAAILVLGRITSIPSFASWSGRIWIGGLILLPIMDVPLAGYVALTVLVLVANAWLVHRGEDRPLVHGVLATINVVLATIAAILVAESVDTLRHGMNGLQTSVQPAVATAVIGVAIVHTVAGVLFRLRLADAIAWTIGAAAPFGLLVLNLASAHGLDGTTVAATLAEVTYIAIASIRPRREPLESIKFEVVTLGLASGFLVVALAVAWAAGPSWAAAVCYATGIAVVAYATSPGRLRAAYVGSAAISVGTATLTHAHDVAVIEVVTVPAAAMLAVIGWLEWRRNPQTPTFLTIGPWLSILLLPTTWQGLGDGQTWRAAVAIVIGALAVIAGFARNGKAPVIIGGFVLLVMAVTHGGPYLAYVPSWVLLYGGGAVLLACGVMWERAISLGRKTARNLAQMR